MALQQQWIMTSIAFALAWSLASVCHVYGTFDLQGLLLGFQKDVWPELLHARFGDAIRILRNSGLVENVYVQHPSSGMPPANLGTAADVWLYVNGGDGDNGVVYEVPKRGLWHPNRLSPGWPDLAGKDLKEAITKITQDYPGVTVIHGLKGFPRIQDFRLDRVWLDVNSNNSIVGVPAIG